jgi:hypothetical protein
MDARKERMETTISESVVDIQLIFFANMRLPLQSTSRSISVFQVANAGSWLYLKGVSLISEVARRQRNWAGCQFRHDIYILACSIETQYLSPDLIVE